MGGDRKAAAWCHAWVALVSLAVALWLLSPMPDPFSVAFLALPGATLLFSSTRRDAVRTHALIALMHAVRSVIVLAVVVVAVAGASEALTPEGQIVMVAVSAALGAYLLVAVPAIAALFVIRGQMWRYPAGRTTAPAIGRICPEFGGDSRRT